MAEIKKGKKIIPDEGKESKAQRRYNHILALGGREMPEQVDLNGRSWLKVKTFKQDFFAATGLYEDASSKEKAVLKLFRDHSYYGIPYQWLSIFEAKHEEKVYLKLQDTGHVPKWIGRYGKTGIMHEYIPGKDLDFNTKIEDDFFPKLEKLLSVMHERGMAYLDTNKPDNILIGDDGNCYLIDFQITWHQPPFPLNILTYPLFCIFKDSDFYHILKHKRKFYPHKISKEDLYNRKPWYIKIHREIANPIRSIRRAYLKKVEKEADYHPEGADKH